MSVIIPTKNRIGLLTQTLQSIGAQTFARWEAVVVDDASTDGTMEMLKVWAERDSRIRPILRVGPRAGAPVCRNLGMRMSSGAYLIYLDSDDLLAPVCLADRVAFMESHPDLESAVFQTRIFYDRLGDCNLYWNAFTSEEDLDRLVREDFPWVVNGPIWRRDALMRVGPWDEEALCLQDWDYHIRALIAGVKYAKVPTADAFVRQSSRPERISARSESPEYLASRTRLYAKITVLLREAGLLTPGRERALLGRFVRLARMRQQTWGQVRSLWRTCRRCGLAGPADAVAFWWVQVVRRMTGWERGSRFVEWRIFPEASYASPTQCRTTMPVS